MHTQATVLSYYSIAAAKMENELQAFISGNILQTVIYASFNWQQQMHTVAEQNCRCNPPSERCRGYLRYLDLCDCFANPESFCILMSLYNGNPHHIRPSLLCKGEVTSEGFPNSNHNLLSFSQVAYQGPFLWYQYEFNMWRRSPTVSS